MDLQKMMKNRKTEFVSLIMVIGLVVFMSIFNSRFVGAKNLQGLLMDMANLMIISAGIMFVLMIGSIDLSAGAIASFSAVITATMVQSASGGGLVIALLFGAAAGLINGLLVIYLHIPSFIATLATMSVWSSMSLVMSGSASVAVPKKYAGVLVPFKWTAGVLSTPILIGIGIVIVSFILLSMTKFGKYSYAIGANETAARMCGAPVKRTKLISFTICGLFSSLLGILLVAKIKSASPYVGDDFDMLGIAAAAMGGISLSGGRGHGLWMVTGCAIIAIVQNGIAVIGVPAYAQKVVYGVIIMLAIIITADRKSKLTVIK